MNGLPQLLWDLRKDKTLAARFREDPDAALDAYELEVDERAAMRVFDIRTLYELGVNPYLLYFCALEIGVDRAEYYARIRGELV